MNRQEHILSHSCCMVRMPHAPASQGYSVVYDDFASFLLRDIFFFSLQLFERGREGGRSGVKGAVWCLGVDGCAEAVVRSVGTGEALNHRGI